MAEAEAARRPGPRRRPRGGVLPRARGVRGAQTILMAHGGGGRMTQRLIESVFLKSFDNPALREMHDGAILEAGGVRLAFSTDSFVIHPLFFPGGDIGSLAVNGTVNDLAMCGAQPLALSAGLILEEGLADRGPRADRRLDAARGRRAPAARSSRATRRSWTAARATASS